MKNFLSVCVYASTMLQYERTLGSHKANIHIYDSLQGHQANTHTLHERKYSKCLVLNNYASIYIKLVTLSI